MLGRVVLLAAACWCACVKSSVLQWQCDEGRRDEELAVRQGGESLAGGRVFEHYVGAAGWWNELAWQKSLDVWENLMSYREQSSVKEPGVLKTSGAVGPDLAHLTPEKLQEALAFVVKLIKLYGPERIVVAFNGGKDATVVLSLYVTALAYLLKDAPPQRRAKPRAVWFKAEQEFDVVATFVAEQVDFWDLDLTVVNGGWAESVGEVVTRLAVTPHPLFLVGLRATDTEQDTTLIATSDATAEVYMRAHPVLNWSYGMIWDYIGLTGIPYCPLYDMGFSSIGKLGESAPNEHLKYADAQYQPASELCAHAWSSERTGRTGGAGKTHRAQLSTEL